MEPYIHFNDEHAYLSRSHMRNDILRSGWNELEQNYGTDITCYALGPILLARVSNVLIFCHI